jgi:Cytochrome P460
MKNHIALLAAIAAFSLPLLASAQTPKPVAANWNETGELLQPVNYREWIYVGTPLTPNDMNAGKAAFPEFHNVYIDPTSWAEYKKTGIFPEGTVMVKELVSVGSKAATSGQGYFQGEFLGLEAAVKSAAKHPKEPGNWGYYSFTKAGAAPGKTAPIMATQACNTCHQNTAKEDYVFTQFYPVLRAAKK